MSKWIEKKLKRASANFNALEATADMGTLPDDIPTELERFRVEAESVNSDDYIFILIENAEKELDAPELQIKTNLLRISRQLDHDRAESAKRQHSISAKIKADKARADHAIWKQCGKEIDAASPHKLSNFTLGEKIKKKLNLSQGPNHIGRTARK
jgi:hypothetical protein